MFPCYDAPCSSAVTVTVPQVSVEKLRTLPDRLTHDVQVTIEPGDDANSYYLNHPAYGGTAQYDGVTRSLAACACLATAGCARLTSGSI